MKPFTCRRAVVVACGVFFSPVSNWKLLSVLSLKNHLIIITVCVWLIAVNFKKRKCRVSCSEVVKLSQEFVSYQMPFFSGFV